jgi:hypothetical protein
MGIIASFLDETCQTGVERNGPGIRNHPAKAQ